MKTSQIITRELGRADASRTAYGQRHAMAWRRNAANIPAMIEALGNYADKYAERFETPIGEDYVLGAEWAQIANGIIGLLNGDLDGLDGGKTDRTIRAIAVNHGVDLDV